MPTRNRLITAAAAGLTLTAASRFLKGRLYSLARRVVLITGGSRGLGLQLAREFVREGAVVALCGRNLESLEQAREELVAAGGHVAVFQCDLEKRDEIRRLIHDVVADFGRLDVLVNNAGIIQVGPFEAMNADDFAHSMNTMFWGALHTTLAALPHLKRGSRIVNVTSIGGVIAVPHLLPYSCAKFAEVGLSFGLRSELRKRGIAVVTVIPGLMRTGSFVHALFKGNKGREYAWFSAGGVTPLTTISGVRAAKKIVTACKAGRSLLVLSWQAKVARVFSALFPGATASLLGKASQHMPGYSGSRDQVAEEGFREVRTLPTRVFTRMGGRAIRKFGQG